MSKSTPDLSRQELYELLEERTARYNIPRFVEDDPIGIPKRYSDKPDVEISAFLTATIAWGQRKSIIRNASRLMEWMDDSPGDFVVNFRESDLKIFETFVHRTFNGTDCTTFLRALQRLYGEYGGLENSVKRSFANEAEKPGSGWNAFKTLFLDVPGLPRTRKHLPDPLKGSAAKRMNMFLRWMVRSDESGVDFGIWKSLSPAGLYIPLDVHTSRQARRLGLLERKQNDWKAVVELTERLREFDAEDPVKYDFALFGMGIWG